MTRNLPPTVRKRAALSCPTCGTRFYFDETHTPPFCSERCQLIDLGRWLDEDIGLPCEAEDLPEDLRDEAQERPSRDAY